MRKLSMLLVVGVAALALAGLDHLAKASPYNYDHTPADVYAPQLAYPTHGKVAVQATPTLVPSSAAAGRSTLTLQNYGADPVCCAWAFPDAGTDVTTANTPCISGASGGAPGNAVLNVRDSKLVYCVAANAQTSPNDLRYFEE